MSVFFLVLAGYLVLSITTAAVLAPWLKSVKAEYEEEAMQTAPDPMVARIQGICRHMSYTPGCTDCKVRAHAASDHMAGVR